MQALDDIVIIGAGIVGLTTGIYLKKQFPERHVVILEKGMITDGASSKNAGFSCFGSVTEILDDLETMSEKAVIDLIRLRGKGLEELMKLTSQDDIQFQKCGSFELFDDLLDEEAKEEAFQKIDMVNGLVAEALDFKNTFEKRKENFGFKLSPTAIFNQYEGQLNPVLLVNALRKHFKECGGLIFNGAHIIDVDTEKGDISLENQVILAPRRIVLCTNAFTKNLLVDLDIIPYRNQVLMTKPIKNLKWNACFHMDRGYIYFRNYRNRLLIGGARNIDLLNEQTDEYGSNSTIHKHLINIIHHRLFSDESIEIDHSWSGIIATGKSKQPIITKMSDSVYLGARLGGMGVAIGSAVGKSLAELISQDIS